MKDHPQLESLFSSKVLSLESLSYQTCCPQHSDLPPQVLPGNPLPGMYLLKHLCYVFPDFCPHFPGGWTSVPLDLLFHTAPDLCAQGFGVGFGQAGPDDSGPSLLARRAQSYGEHMTCTTHSSCDFSPQFCRFGDLGVRAQQLDGHLQLEASLPVT